MTLVKPWKTSVLRDRHVCGVNDEWLQRRLLAETELTYQEALELSQTFKSSVKDAKDLQSPRAPVAPVAMNLVSDSTKTEQKASVL